jgi:hypothetical protein
VVRSFQSVPIKLICFMAMKLLTISYAIALLVQSSPVHAESIYQYQQLPGQFGGFTSDGSVLTVADNFQLGQDTLIGGLIWWGGNGNSPLGPDNFTVCLYSDNGGQPGALLEHCAFGAVNAIATGQFVNAPDLYPEFEYSANLPTPFPAQAGVMYWLGIVNPSAYGWLWEASASPLNPGVERSFNGGSWEPYYDNTSFALVAVPEPHGMILITTSLVSIMVFIGSRRGTRNRCVKSRAGVIFAKSVPAFMSSAV